MKRFILVGTAILVIAGLYTGKTMAKNRVSAYVDKTVTTSSLDLSLCVSGAGIDDKGNMQTNGINTIDDTIEQRVSVLNSGEKAQYVRVKISKDNWVNINMINKDDWIVPDNHTDSENVNWDAEAVQTVAAGDAMLTEWGVEAELGDDGSLKAVSDR